MTSNDSITYTGSNASDVVRWTHGRGYNRTGAWPSRAGDPLHFLPAGDHGARSVQVNPGDSLEAHSEGGIIFRKPAPGAVLDAGVAPGERQPAPKQTAADLELRKFALEQSVTLWTGRPTASGQPGDAAVKIAGDFLAFLKGEQPEATK